MEPASEYLKKIVWGLIDEGKLTVVDKKTYEYACDCRDKYLKHYGEGKTE